MTDAFDPALFPDRLNLGCGYDIRAGYLNVDVNDFHSPDLVADVTNLHMLPAGRYREILAQDVLEHLPRTATVDVLREWNRLLAVGGTVHLRVPSVLDLSLLLRAPENQSVEMQEKLIQCLFGTQAYSEDTHLTTFTEPLLRHYLDEAGFAVVKWGLRDQWLFEVTAEKLRSVEASSETASGAERAASPASVSPEPTQLPLRELIQAGANPPLQAEASSVKRATRQVLLQMGRPHAVHQQRVDLEMLHRLEEVEHRQRELSEWLLVTSNRGDETAGRAIGLEQALQGLAERSSEFEERLARMIELVPGDGPLYGDGAFQLERFDAGLGGTVVGFRDGNGRDTADELYLSFQDYFRGSEDVIRERQRAYLPLLQGRDRVLDVGCGRGEFLELMRELGVPAQGVDLDSGMVEHCRAKGLDDVQVGDAVGYLESLEDHSLGAVFAAQLIEHLPYQDLLRFLSAARDKLEPGGLLVMETVNPHAAQALKNFWIDPTHRHPLFPETVIALCGLTGFAGAYVWHPQGAGDPDRDRIQQADYAVIAQAPNRHTWVPGRDPEN
jgi:predicted SAM-dependent methyltransferase